MEVTVCGQKHKTDVVKDSADPDFSANNSFRFEIPDEEVYDADMHIEVRDKHMIRDDIMAAVKIPLSSLKSHSVPPNIDTSSSSQIIPLRLKNESLDRCKYEHLSH